MSIGIKNIDNGGTAFKQISVSCNIKQIGR